MRCGWLTVLLGCSLLVEAQPASQNASLPGYSPQAAAKEMQWEEKFRALPSPDNLRADMQHLTARPHHVGSPYDKENAEWMRDRFREWGWDAQIETFYVLFPTPKERVLELIAPGTFKAKLQEPAVPVDPTSSQQSEQLPTYNAYSVDGEVSAPLVYVNYGTRDDFDQLDRLGISVKGAIVIARYGHAWRGIKPKVAAERGAIGCIIYSDPRDDGYGDGVTYPAGPSRPKDSVQRGAVTDTFYPGDPLTPGVGATKDAKRMAIKDSPQITKIPVLPISYGDAQPLLEAIGGQAVPEDWRGGLPITYRLGPGPAKVHLRVASNWDIKPIYDVIAKIPGSTEPDQWVIRGNHHDAWVNGADDPISGMVAVLEEARSIGELVKQGWKPRRTLIYCAWDGEEPGLLGSTEWVETHIQELKQHAVMYVNSDSTARGFLHVSGAHSLEQMINAVEKEVPDPETRFNIWERARLMRIARAKSADLRAELRHREDLRISALGDGSDYSPFIDYAGIPSLNMGFGGEDAGGVYHSIYDDFYWYTHFSDSKFVYGRALAETAGTAMMRMADAEVLDYDFTDVADTMRTYVNELETQLKQTRAEIEERNRELDEEAFAAVADPEKTDVPPKREAVPPYLNMAPLENGVTTLTRSAERYQKAMTAAAKSGALYDDANSRAVDDLLMKVERATLREQGLPGRPWYKNQVYAPGAYTGYGVKTLPGVREAMDQHDWATADKESVVIGSVLNDESKAIDAVSEKLESLAGR
jgi:N-acetylated-alpha-linked acidic dipeptidase